MRLVQFSHAAPAHSPTSSPSPHLRNLSVINSRLSSAKKATTYDSLLKWISHTKIQSVHTRTEAWKGQLTQADLWPAQSVCMDGYVRLYWSVYVVSTGLAGSGFNVVQPGSMWLHLQEVKGEAAPPAARNSMHVLPQWTLSPSPHSFLHWHQIVASICCHSGECSQIISSEGCCCLPTYCLPHRSRAQVMTHSWS